MKLQKAVYPGKTGVTQRTPDGRTRIGYMKGGQSYVATRKTSKDKATGCRAAHTNTSVFDRRGSKRIEQTGYRDDYGPSTEKTRKVGYGEATVSREGANKKQRAPIKRSK